MHKLFAYIIIVVGVTIVGLISYLLKYRKAGKINKGLLDLKEKGKQIDVQFQDCEIKTREYFDTETSDAMPSRIEMLDSLRDSGRSNEGVKKVVSVLIYKYDDPFGKSKEFTSEVIEMPVERLRFLLENKKHTTIFVDNDNWNRYYFDLGFLHN